MHPRRYRTVTVVDGALMVVGCWLQIHIQESTPLAMLSSFSVLVGLGMGLATNSLTAAVQNMATPEQMGVATSSTIFSRVLGAVVGVSVMGSILSHRMASRLAQIFAAAGIDGMSKLAALTNPRLLMRPETRAMIPPEHLPSVQHALYAGLEGAFIVGFIAACGGLVFSLMMPNKTPLEQV